MSFGLQTFDQYGREQLYGYQVRNIVQVKHVDTYTEPSGRIWPYGSYSGSFRWVVSSCPSLGYKASVVTRHSDGSISWRQVTNSDQGGEGGEYFMILGVVER